MRIRYWRNDFWDRLGRQALRARAINRWEKTRIRNLQYGPKTRLIRGIYVSMFKNNIYTYMQWIYKMKGEKHILRNTIKGISNKGQ